MTREGSAASRMPRIPVVTDPDPEARDLLAKTLIEGLSVPLNIFRTLAHHPRLLRRFNALGGLFLVHGLLPSREREIVVLRTAWKSASEYEWGQHVLIARRIGLSYEEIEAIATPAPQMNRDDRNLLAFVDEMLERADTSAEAWDRQMSRWSEAQMIELVFLIGFYRMVAGFLNAGQVEREGSLPRWPGVRDSTPGPNGRSS